MDNQKATVGRVVHFYNNALSDGANNGTGKGPYAAIVTQVFDTSGPYVNLKVLPYGTPWDEGSVSPYDAQTNNSRYWVWPPKV